MGTSGTIAAVAAALLIVGPQAHADVLDDLERAEKSGPVSSRGPFGIGLFLGAPSSLTGKLMVDGTSGVQVHIGYGVGSRGRLVLAGDYLFHFWRVLPDAGRVGSLVPYAGGGARLGVRDNNENALFGVRIPLGLSLWLRKVPIEVFLEVAPGLSLIPETQGTIDGGIGARWYF